MESKVSEIGEACRAGVERKGFSPLTYIILTYTVARSISKKILIKPIIRIPQEMHESLA